MISPRKIWIYNETQTKQYQQTHRQYFQFQYLSLININHLNFILFININIIILTLFNFKLNLQQIISILLKLIQINIINKLIDIDREIVTKMIQNPQKEVNLQKTTGRIILKTPSRKSKLPISLKSQSRQSFEVNLPNIGQFNSSISKQYEKMLVQKQQNPSLMIPQNFDKFIHSKLFQNLLQKIYQYMDLLVDSQKRYKNMKRITNQFGHYNRYETGLHNMKYQTHQLQNKCKEISYIYMGILLSYGESRFIFKDQYFFQTMIYFINQILKTIFQEDDMNIVEEQLSRIFRTNAFNLIKRRHDQDNINQKYPALKQAKYEASPHGMNRIIKRLSIQRKFNYSMQIKPDKMERMKKPVQMQLSSFGSVQSRSPLISSLYPCSREKLYQFGKSAREKQSLIKATSRRSNSFFFPLKH